jgi:hypothetical protein
MPNFEEIILVAEDCRVSKSEAPPLGDRKKTIARIGYEVLIENPYFFSEQEFFKEIHFEQRKRYDLKIESYNIKRSELVKSYGWGVHRNKEGKLALVPMESTEYKKLQETIKNSKSYRKKKL